MNNDSPNILWYCTDQQRYDTIGALNNPYVNTPQIDQMVGRGTAFTQTYCQSPICTPSRASFLTGCYPNAIRTPRNGNFVYADQYPLISKILSDHGYDCGLVGKLHLASSFQRIEPRVDDGYRYFKWSHAPRDDWEEGHDYAEWVLQKGGGLKELVKDIQGIPAELHQTTWATDRSIEFIKEKREGPWFLSVNVYDPHPPFNPPKHYRDLFDPESMPDPLFQESDLVQQKILEPIDFQSKVSRPEALDICDPILPRTPTANSVRGDDPSPGERDAWTLKAAYYAMIKLIDDQFGRLVKFLEETGQLENSLIIFSTDHGESLGDHGLIEKGCRFYEGLVHVPLIFSLPGIVKANLQSKALVELMDITPTLLEIVGIPIPAYMQGHSLWPILTGSKRPESHKLMVRSEFFDALNQPFQTRATMLRDERFKLVVYHGVGLGELYDLEQDPGEFNNLWDEPGSSEIKNKMILKSFDASMMAVDLGPQCIGPM
ncbi:MAG: sulfatase-like hydrolase/transferase [SAR324 cluster bacterium]|nr:sulfatase-like hydrolase/transferase [SAR324 cluster bacterium]